MASEGLPSDFHPVFPPDSSGGLDVPPPNTRAFLGMFLKTWASMVNTSFLVDSRHHTLEKEDLLVESWVPINYSPRTPQKE